MSKIDWESRAERAERAEQQLEKIRSERDRIQQQVFNYAKELQAKEDLRLTNIGDLQNQRDVAINRAKKAEQTIAAQAKELEEREKEFYKQSGVIAAHKAEIKAMREVIATCKHQILMALDSSCLTADDWPELNDALISIAKLSALKAEGKP